MARDGSLTRAGALGNFGLDWGHSSGGLYSDNGAVCWMTPDDTTGDTGEPVVVAHLTVPAGTGDLHGGGRRALPVRRRHGLPR